MRKKERPQPALSVIPIVVKVVKGPVAIATRPSQPSGDNNRNGEQTIMTETPEAGRGRGGRGRGRGRAGRQGRGRGGPGRSGRGGANATGTADGAEERSLITSNAQAPKETTTADSTNGDTGRGGGRAAGRGGRGKGSGGARGRGNNKGNKNQPQEQHQKQKQNLKNKDFELQLKQTNVKKKDKNKPKNDNKQQGRAPPDKKNKDRTAAATNHANTTHAPSIPPSQSQQTSDINYMRGESITILHVAEKPSIAQAIAKGLAPPSVNLSSRSNKLPVHEFTDTVRPFPKAPYAARCRHRVTSVAGHVFNVDFPPQFQSWESVDPAELFHAPTVRKPCQGSVVRHLQEEARGVHFIVLWMDCDREGENINFEVLDCCMHLMASGGGGGSNYDRVYRAHFSAINPTDIQKAYQNLGKPDKNQSLSVEARQELDLKVGVAFSRFQTRFFQGRYGDLDSAVLTYGPCQTPTLGFCVQRHMEIETFKPGM